MSVVRYFPDETVVSVEFPLVKIRLKSVQNMEKITKSMKMVSAAKFTHSERELKPARTSGEGATGMWLPLLMFM